MKKLVFLLFICTLSLGVSAQQDSLRKVKVNFGMMLNPQGGISLKNPDKGFSVTIPLFVILPIEKGNLSLTPLYSLTDNSVGGFATYSFPKVGVYFVGIKSIQRSDLYLGVGAGVPVAEKRASAFIEIGTTQEWNTQVFLGISIPFTLKLR